MSAAKPKGCPKPCLVAALAQVLSTKPNADWAEELVKLLPSVKWPHTVKLVLSAILSCAPNGLVMEDDTHVGLTVADHLKEDERVRDLLKQINELAWGRYIHDNRLRHTSPGSWLDIV